MARGAQSINNGAITVFVGENAPLARDDGYLFVGKLGRGIGASGAYVVRSQIWIERHQLLRRSALRELAHDVLYRKAGSADDGLTQHDRRVDYDPLEYVVH